MDIPTLELILLLAAEAGDEREVIVGTAVLITFAEPAADVAVGARLRVGICRRAGLGGAGELAFHKAVVGCVVVDAMRFADEFRSGNDDPHQFRCVAQNRGEQLRVEGQLQDGGSFSFAGEFAVVGFIRPVSEHTGFVHFSQDVRSAEPSGAAERALVDHVHSALHGEASFFQGFSFDLHGGQIGNLQAALGQEREVIGFVF